MRNKGLKKEAIALQTWVMALSLVAVFMIYLTLNMSPVAASPWTVTKWKTKSLPIAGDVYFTSSISAIDGEEITIEIQPVDSSVTIVSVVLDKPTPKPRDWDPTSTYITQDPSGPYNSGHKINVTLKNGQRFKTFHLWLHLNTGEHLGVNVHF